MNWLLRIGLPLLLCATVVSCQTGNKASLVVPDDGSFADVAARATSGATIVVRAGVHSVAKCVSLSQNSLTVAGEPGAVLQAVPGVEGVALLDIHGTNVRVEGLVLDGQFAAARGIRGRRAAKGLTVTGCEVRHWADHGLDVDGDETIIEDCQIHHNLRKGAEKREDAHGIVSLHAQGLTIRNCRIWNCSGDAIQAERGKWQDLVITDCELYYEPLTEDMAGFSRGDYVGENVLDTKRPSGGEPGRIRVENCRAWGCRNLAIGDCAAFNLKENVETTISSCEVRDCHIAFRLASFRKGGKLQCAVSDCTIRDCDVGFRIEDQQANKPKLTGATIITGCRVENCAISIVFDSIKANGPLGKTGFKPGSTMTDCVFVPELRLGPKWDNQKEGPALKKTLLALGNREEAGAGTASPAGENPAASLAAKSVKPAKPGTTEDASPRDGGTQLRQEPQSRVVPDDGPFDKVIADIPNNSTVTVKPGVHSIPGPVKLTSRGVTIRGEPGAVLQGAPDLRGVALLDVHGVNATVTGLVFDGRFAPIRGIRGRRTAQGLTVSGCELKHWSNHALDVDGDQTLIENCQIHDNLLKTNGKRDDAHGVVSLHANGLTIRKCRIWNCSGDAIQAERGKWQNLVIEDCDLFFEPLEEERAGFGKGEYVGENALDTKRGAGLEVGRIRVENTRAWGCRNLSIGDCAAFNLKENVEVQVIESHVHDSHIAFRLATFRKGGTLRCDIRDCTARDCAFGFRVEDQEVNKPDLKGAVKISRCRVENCQVSIAFADVKAQGPLGKLGFKPGSTMTDCVFVPELRLGPKWDQQKEGLELRTHLLSLGNREESGSATPAPDAVPERKDRQPEAVDDDTAAEDRSVNSIETLVAAADPEEVRQAASDDFVEVAAARVVPDDGTFPEVVSRIAKGETITVKAGVHLISQPVKLQASGVTIRGEPGAVLRAETGMKGVALLDVHGSQTTIEGLIFDGRFARARGIRGRKSATHLIVRKCEVAGWSDHAVDIDGDQSLVEDCQIHDNLLKIDGKRDDAHGVVTLNARELTIRRCRIWNCSGDAIQADRGRWQDLVIEDCDLYYEPLASDMAGFSKGEYVGENALDTKRASEEEVGRIRVENCRAWGYRNLSIGDCAAYNLKEKVQVEAINCEVYNSNIAFRLSTFRKGGQMQCEIRNCFIHDSGVAFRVEDQALKSPEVKGATLISGCLIQDCAMAIDFVDVTAKGAGKLGFKEGSSMTDCVFIPLLKMRIDGDKASYARLKQHWLSQGNSEDSGRGKASRRRPVSTAQ